MPTPGFPDSAVTEPEQASAPKAGDILAHVLIVDDNEINLRVARSFCELLGFTCEFARDGAEAVEAVRAGCFDLILMDIHMPGMDGLEATHAIRSLPDHMAGVPIIAVTANVDAEERDAYQAAGMCAVVPKPIDIHRLFEAIEQALA